MNAPAIPPPEAAALRVYLNVNTRFGFVSHRGTVAKVSPDTAVLIRLLVKVSPGLVPRDRIMKTVFAGKRAHKNSPASLRQIVRRARTAVRPLGIEIFHAKNPIGEDQPGFYGIGIPDRCEFPRDDA